jgi:ATP-dependent Clp protease ATP-binding subunit ClpA
VEAGRKRFSPEFMNRIDKIVIHSLNREEVADVLKIELGQV